MGHNYYADSSQPVYDCCQEVVVTEKIAGGAERLAITSVRKLKCCFRQLCRTTEGEVCWSY